ncbi:hypothetical protein ALC57_14352, partial [Trachymyrmex cornetzi]
VVDTRCLRQGDGSFVRATRLDDDDEVSARLRCGMIVCHRHPTRATGNHADGIELSASTTEANAKLEIYPSGNGWFEAGIPVTRFIAQRRTRGAGKQQVVERRETVTSAAFSQVAEGSLDRTDLAARIIGSDLVHRRRDHHLCFTAPLTDVLIGYDRS